MRKKSICICVAAFLTMVSLALIAQKKSIHFEGEVTVLTKTILGFVHTKRNVKTLLGEPSEAMIMSSSEFWHYESKNLVLMFSDDELIKVEKVACGQKTQPSE